MGDTKKKKIKIKAILKTSMNLTFISNTDAGTSKLPLVDV